MAGKLRYTERLTLKGHSMNDSNILARAEQMLSMLSDDDKDFVLRKLERPGKKTPALLAVATALARFETKNGTRTAKARLTKALIKIGSQPQGV